MTHPDDEAARRAEFEALWSDHRTFLLGFALRRTHRDRAADVVDEAFAAAWRRIDERPVDARGWLVGILRGVLANDRRAEGRRRALAERLAGLRQPAAPDPADAPDVPQARAFRRLPAADRDLLGMLEWDGLTREQAAAALGCREGALKVRVHRARRRLERLLAEERGEPVPARIQEEPR